MKEYLVTASQMKQYDKNTIDIHRIPSAFDGKGQGL